MTTQSAAIPINSREKNQGEIIGGFDRYGEKVIRDKVTKVSECCAPDQGTCTCNIVFETLKT